jgi:hypothetical protein
MLVLRQALDRARVGLLDEILGVVVVPRHPARQPKELVKVV